MEWKRDVTKEGGASEGKARRSREGMKGGEGFWKGPLMNSFPLSRGISLSRHPWNRCRALRWDFALAKLSPWVAHGGTKRAFTLLWPISRRHDLNNHRTTNHHSPPLSLLAAVSSPFLILLLLFPLQASPCGGHFYQLCPARFLSQSSPRGGMQSSPIINRQLSLLLLLLHRYFLAGE